MAGWTFDWVQMRNQAACLDGTLTEFRGRNFSRLHGSSVLRSRVDTLAHDLSLGLLEDLNIRLQNKSQLAACVQRKPIFVGNYDREEELISQSNL